MFGIPRVAVWLLVVASGVRAAHGAGAAEFTEFRGLLHLNGYTHHFAAPDANDNLFGPGFTWYGGRVGRFTMAWEADIFRDSGRKLSGYIGRSFTMPLHFGNVGVTGALMYHRNFATQNRLRILPVALPYWETRGTGLRLRFYYVPPIRNACDQPMAIQVLALLWR